MVNLQLHAVGSYYRAQSTCIFLTQLLSQFRVATHGCTTPTLGLYGQSSTQGLFVILPFPVLFFSSSVHALLCITVCSYCLHLPIGLLEYWFLTKRKFGDSCWTVGNKTPWRLLGSESGCGLLGFNTWMIKLGRNSWLWVNCIHFDLFLKIYSTGIYLLVCFWFSLDINLF